MVSVPLRKDRLLPSSGLAIDDLLCKYCNMILDEPIELPCKHLVCCSCCFSLLRTNVHSLLCPHCQQHHELVVSSFQAPAPLTDKCLQQLVIRCDRITCNKVVHLRDLKAHIDSKCVIHDSSTIKHTITLDQILQQPV